MLRNKDFFGLWGIALALLALAPPSQATPQFARKFDVSCNACHTIPPMLSAEGLAFQAGAYVPREREIEATEERAEPRYKTIPMAAWVTFRHEDQGEDGASELYLPKVELISGGRINKRWAYFVEWRIVSLGLRPDGELFDRSGRFEDLFFDWGFVDTHMVRFGQYRALNQVDVSLRLSTSEPLLFRNGLRVGTDDDPRVDALSRFSPSGRSPGFTYGVRSVAGETTSDGLFHFVTVPFVGEFSIPLTPEAQDNASFELGEAKGLYFETFWRKGLTSIGGHAFSDFDGAWLVTALGTYNWKDFLLTAGLGVDAEPDRASRNRYSLQGEYFFLKNDRIRPGVGFRVEDVSGDNQREAYVPYFVVSAPTTRYSFLLQLQYRNREGSDVFVADLSAVF